MKKGLRCILYIIAIVITFGFNNTFLFSQEESEGKEFFLTFMPNYHNYPGRTSIDSIYIFITSQIPTKGTIAYKKFNTKTQEYVDTTHNFQITEPNGIYKFKLQYFYYELNGFNDNGMLLPKKSDKHECEKVTTNKTFYIKTDEKSTVYAFEYGDKSAEAFLVLPVAALGEEYYILTYNSDGKIGYNKTLAGSSTPSQFAIVATEDNTNIVINPSSNTFVNGIEQQNITLNKGETYLVQSEIKSDNLIFDLTGTYIKADKNIAVFAGHQRATVPVHNSSSSNPSRDCLIEQLVPVNAWGRNAIIVPFVQTTTTKEYKDIFRVIAAKDSTIILLNGKQIGLLNAGEFLEQDLTAGLLTANKPIMVGQYNVTSSFDYDIIHYTRYGDPSMLVVPPVEQYKNSYNIINIQTGDIIKYQYLNLIAPDTSINKVYIDNQLVDPKQFKKIENTGFAYAQIKVTDNGHNIKCEDDIGIQIYGYGDAISYSYCGGMYFKDLEKEKISIIIDSCNKIFYLDYREIFSSGIKSYQIVQNENCKIIEKEFEKQRLKLEIEPVDPNMTGCFSIKITDIYDVETIISDTINPYIINSEISSSIYFDNCKIGTLNSKEFFVTNDGLTPITINSNNIYLSNKTRFTISQEALPAVLNPGDTLKLKLYYSPINGNTVDYDTLQIGIYPYCVTNKFIYIEGNSIQDTIKLNTKCSIPINMVAKNIDYDIELPIVYPNPAKTKLTYKFNNLENGNAVISIYDVNGNIISNIFNSYLDKGIYEITLPIENLSPGQYIIKLTTDTSIITNKFIKVL
ncbi:MAG: T9SS type A sorting domain-containing protein [Bacteroidetes bacterium]|nr:T9SS type A sorting domain-containing protein [Bacteroidota bacterium]